MMLKTRLLVCLSLITLVGNVKCNSTSGAYVASSEEIIVENKSNSSNNENEGVTAMQKDNIQVAIHPDESHSSAAIVKRAEGKNEGKEIDPVRSDEDQLEDASDEDPGHDADDHDTEEEADLNEASADESDMFARQAENTTTSIRTTSRTTSRATISTSKNPNGTTTNPNDTTTEDINPGPIGGSNGIMYTKIETLCAVTLLYLVRLLMNVYHSH